MTRVTSKYQLLFLFSYVIFIANTFAEPVPEAVQREFIAHRQRQREVALSSNASSVHPTVMTSNWAGATQLKLDGRVVEVSAQWTIPTATLWMPGNNSVSNGTWLIGEWVGVDGYSKCPSNVFAVGTYSYVQVSSSGDVTTGAFAFYDWYPANIAIVNEFNATIGDEAVFSMSVISDSVATITMRNLNTGAHIITNVSSPISSDNLCGLSADWMLSIPSTYDSVPFPVVNGFSFQNCYAVASSGNIFGLPNATLFIMEQNSTVLAMPAANDSGELSFTFGL